MDKYINKALFKEKYLCFGYIEGMSEQEFDSFPDISISLKEGEWIPGEQNCPICGEDKFKDLDADIWADWQPSYCPNCGAKMRKGD